MAEVIAALVPVLIELASGSYHHLRDCCVGVHKLRKEWEETLKENLGVLEDAEWKQLRDNKVKSWLDDLHDLTYDIDDFEDHLATEVQARQINRSRASTSRFPNCISAACLINNCGINPVAFKFNLKMKLKVKISHRLRDISQRRGTLGLIQSNISDPEMVATKSLPLPPTKLPATNSLRPSHVIGREKEKKEIVEMLKTEAEAVEIPVITILGMGGMGKTTLAQDVYNDKEVQGCFDLRAWVCVSDVFDVTNITRAILIEITGEDYMEKLELNQLQVKLKEMLSGKKFLLVLDDIWNEDYLKWENLLLPFPSGAAAVGSRILATTRNEPVASTMSVTGPRYHLKELGEGDCLSLLASLALQRNDFAEHQFLKESGKKIVKKCGHLPLAIKMVGGLLRKKPQQKHDWEDVINSNKWAETSGSILPALRVSYYHLPSHLKRCFAYCSIIPKDYIFDKTDLVLLWMAEGLLKKPAGEMVEFGHNCFQELLSRSFFQLTDGSESEFFMHDLINDLAVDIAGERCFRMDDAWDKNQENKISERTRHLSFISHDYEVFKKFDIFNKARRSRTFLSLPPHRFSSSRYSHTFNISDADLALMLSPLRSLRVLNLKGYNIIELPNPDGVLKHLRYLNLSSTKIEQLPQFVCSLYNLQTLSLNSCKRLHELPSSIGWLTNLRHLGLEDTPKLEKMPSGIGKLTSLQSLSKIIVGRDTGTSNLKDLKDLRHLHGTLSIKELHNVTNDQDAVDADLRSKEHLKVLKLQWQYFSDSANSSRDRPLEKRVLEKLQPHCNLEVLDIEGFGGIEFPSWVGGQPMSNVVSISLEGCSEITRLPPLGKLPLLKYLVIKDLGCITSVGAEFYGDCAEEIAFSSLETLSFYGDCAEEIAFSSLETLSFNNITKWKEWSLPVADKGLFSHLRDLKIADCPELEKLPKGLHGLASLQEMCIINCPSLVWDATDQLPKSLVKLELCNCPKSVLSNWGFHRLTSLRSLVMKVFEDVVSFGLVGDSNGGGASTSTSTSTSTSYLFPPSLTKLSICSFPNLKSLSNSLQNLTSLRELYMSDCPKLESLAEADNDEASLQIIRSLNELTIAGRSSEGLRKRCEKEEGKYWPTIRHIPKVNI